ncbi:MULTISPECIES: NAD-dependent epimerase/dehydratase family protein [Bacillus]|uniref:NAD-dependent epimerase/dehydratase family protein n=1 Tax=Bacillus TaxID=1386 RepID=UPI000E5985C5|nr:SDR family NAD(P)-dependent oxidoreductase [Bacillus cereus]MDF9543250.1 SDR family NAD(P)-dependent oxidoreductase [Bacillus cereus]RHW10183.1 hypothetical protein B7P27_03230 [Bacillus cereus]HDR4455148.1 SDR family NAD(P)-dependent oxidoreductase [Bacillus cereus]
MLVTGGAGYIGSHTCVELLNSSYEIIVVDNLSNSSVESINRVKEITGKQFKFYKEDVLNREALEAIFEENAIEAVIHFAGFKAVGESVAIPLTYYHNNITSTLVLCEVMQKHNVKKIIFSSSATGVRDYIHVVDLASGHVKALEKVLSTTGVDAYNLGTGTGYSVLEMVEAFEKVSGKKVPYKITERRPGDGAVCFADASKAKRELGWEATRGLEEMCADSWKWQSNNKNGYMDNET